MNADNDVVLYVPRDFVLARIDALNFLAAALMDSGNVELSKCVRAEIERWVRLTGPDGSFGEPQ